MEIEFQSESHEHDVLACVSSNGKKALDLSGELDDLVCRALGSHRFSGKAGTNVEILVPPEFVKADRLVVLGVGKKPEASSYEKAGARLVSSLLSSGVKSVVLRGVKDARMQAHLALGAKLASYRFDTYRSKLKDEERPSLEKLVLTGDNAEEAKALFACMEAVSEGVFLARDLVSEPPNKLYPESYAQRVSELQSDGLKVTILDEDRMGELGMNLLLGVGQGSVRGSRLCVLEWSGAGDEPPLALVGKGVTFDTGGISLKPSGSMEEMKGDMAGSAAVVGTMKALARRGAKANVVGLIGLVENMPGGGAIRPGDIIGSASGQSVEVLNTDAEGRLVLADVLWYAQKFYKPRAIVDLATLTGAIIISLGHEYAGLFCNDDGLAEGLSEAGESVGEPVWRFPLSASYDKLLDSKVADMKNISGGRAAGSITAAQFLKRFVKKGIPWAHLDIAGKAWRAGSGKLSEPGWATGYGVRLLDRLVSESFED